MVNKKQAEISLKIWILNTISNFIKVNQNEMTHEEYQQIKLV